MVQVLTNTSDRLWTMVEEVPKNPEPYEPTPAALELIERARSAFLQDSAYAVDIGKAAAPLADRRREAEDAPPKAREPHSCPEWHDHGSARCMDRDGCRCAVCEQARVDRRAGWREKTLRRHEPMPVTIRYTTPTKTAQEVAEARQRVNRGGRPRVTPQPPVELPEGVVHGTWRSVKPPFRCRCIECLDYLNGARQRADDRDRREASERLQKQVPEHGSTRRYKAGCRCDSCTEAQREAWRRYENARRAKQPKTVQEPRVHKEPQHGTGTLYQAPYRCRCDPCRAWKKQENQRYKARKLSDTESSKSDTPPRVSPSSDSSSEE